MKAYSGIIKLACLLILAPIVIWNFALGETYRLYKEKQKLQEVNQNTSATLQPSKAAAPLSSAPLLSNGEILRSLAETLANEQVEVISYSPELIDSEDSHKLYCGKLILSGEYINLVKVVSAIEKADLPLKIASMSFEYDRKKREAERKISLRLLFEQIEH